MFSVSYVLRSALRHRQRTAAAVVALALASGLVMTGYSVLDGLQHSIGVELSRRAGHVRVATEATWAKRSRSSLTHAATDREATVARLRAVDEVACVAPHLQAAVGLLFTDRSEVVDLATVESEEALTDEQIFGRSVHQFARVTGVDFRAERCASHLHERLSSGTYPEPAEMHDAAILGRGLATRLGVNSGDTLDLVSTRGGLRIREVVVRGIVDTGNLRTNRSAWVSLRVVEQVVGAPDGATDYAVYGHRLESASQLALAVNRALDRGELEARPWNEIGVIGPLLRILDFILLMLLSILLGVAGAGLLNIMLAAVLERRQEFGLLQAMGVQRSRVVALVALEAGGIATVGTALGIALGAALSSALAVWGIPLDPSWVDRIPVAIGDAIYARLSWGALLYPAALAWGVSVLGSLPPAYLAGRTQAAAALSDR